MKFVFIVLHYIAWEDTIECVDSIINNIDYQDKQIIIIDNASPNNSFEKLQYKYHKYKNIILLQNSINLGFAKGNNVGFYYAKYVLKANYIVMLNNDTVIKQRDFITVIIRKFNQTKFAVMGPDIETIDGYHQNPLKKRNWTLLKLYLFKIKTLLRLIDINLFCICPVILPFIRIIREHKNTLIGDYTNIRLHGACLIFSPIYIDNFDGLDEGTFLYMEEDLLQMQMDHHNLTMIYTSELKILHKEDVSTNMLYSSNKEKNKRFLEHLLNSIDVCILRIKEIREGGK